MHFSRIAPILLYKDGGLYKTRQFSNPDYLGDPVNIINILNTKQVDELVIFDISEATSPAIHSIAEMASECFMPLSYGGKIRSLEDATRILEVGVEKVILNSVLYETIQIVDELVGLAGSQSVAATIDYRIDSNGNRVCYSNGGRTKTNRLVAEHLMDLQSRGIGEVVLQCIDHDGMSKGYDLAILDIVNTSTNIPIMMVGGARGVSDFRAALAAGASAVGAGSAFCYVGPLRGKLPSYLSPKEIEENIPQ